MKISLDELEMLLTKALKTQYSEEEADRISQVMLFAEISGKKSHGINRLMGSGSSVLSQKPVGKVKVNNKTKISKLINGNRNPAMLVGHIAVEEVINIANENSFGIVGTNNTFSTSGCLTYYINQIAHNDLIGIVMARAEASIAPNGGYERLFGTNPIAFAIPTSEKPFLLDMGSSAISFGAVLNALNSGEQLPKNVAIDQMGKPTTDPQAAIDGSLRPFDRSYKGSGLAMIVEILAGILPSAGFGDINPEDGWGNTFIALSPELLGDTEEFKSKASQLVQRVKTSKSIAGKPIRVAGEKTLTNYERALEEGSIEVNEGIINQIKELIK